MCHAMNRSFIPRHPRRFWRRDPRRGTPAGATGEQKPVKLGSADDAAFIMKNASEGHHRARLLAWRWRRPSTRCAKMGDILKKEGVEVKYAIHPVAGPHCPAT